ncbi:hypothetical protein [Chroococcidiopsis sp.]
MKVVYQLRRNNIIRRDKFLRFVRRQNRATKGDRISAKVVCPTN